MKFEYIEGTTDSIKLKIFFPIHGNALKSASL